MRPLRRRPWVWILAIVLVAAAIATVLWRRGPAVDTALSRMEAIEQHLVASGRVWVPTRVQVAAPVAGLVVVVAAVEGQRVKAGELLVQVDDSEARAQVAQAEAQVAQANARVGQLRRVGAIVASEGLREAQANLDRAEAAYARAQSLFAQGAAARADLEEAQRAVEVARAQKGSAEAQQISAAPLGADSRVALTALLQAQAQLEGAKVRLAQTQVTALHDGVILTRSVQPGDVVQPTRTLLVMAVDADTQLVVHPDERSLSSITLGQKARAAADAYPQAVFDAEVSFIAPSIDPARGSIEVRLRVPAPPAFLKPDMTVSIDLTVASKASALTVPREAVRDAASAQPWVWTVEGGRAVRRDVTLGLRGEGTVEITAGLADGAEVVVNAGQALKAGQRVRAERVELD